MERNAYRLFDEYFIEETEDRVQWMRIFSDQQRLMRGRGTYRDDVLVLLHPYRIDDITSEEGLRDELEFERLPVWSKTRYLVHMGSENQGFPVQDAVETTTGRHLAGDEVRSLVEKIQAAFDGS